MVRSVLCMLTGMVVPNILLSHYSNVDKLDSLLDEGDISCLREIVGEKHDFDDFIQGTESPANKNEWTTFYGRDRGEKDCEACVFETLDELLVSAKGRWAEYVYVWPDEVESWEFGRIVASWIDSGLQDLKEHLRQIDLEETVVR